MTKLFCKTTALLITAVLAAGATALPASAASADMGRLSAGIEYSLYVDAKGDLYAFGDNFPRNREQDTKTYLTPQKVMGDVKAVSAGGNHYMVIKKDGSVWATGSGHQGELGDGRHYIANMSGTAPQDATIRTVKVFEKAAAVSAADYHTLVLDQKGQVWGTGRNQKDGVSEDSATFVKVKGLSGVTAIAADTNHNLALTKNGDVYAWGISAYGALGDGRNAEIILSSDGWSHTYKVHEASTPVRIMGGIRAIAAGGGTSYMLGTDGTLWGCGYNMSGQLGNGTTNSTPTPIRILDGVKDISVGNGAVLAIKTDNTVWGWGSNVRGNLGLAENSSGQYKTPTKVADNAAAVAVGWDNSLMLKEDGSLWTTGGNDRGQLGNGKKPPVQRRQFGFKKIKSS